MKRVLRHGHGRPHNGNGGGGGGGGVGVGGGGGGGYLTSRVGTPVAQFRRLEAASPLGGRGA